MTSSFNIQTWDLAGVGIIVVSPAGKIIQENSMAKELLGSGDGLLSRLGTISTSNHITTGILADRIYQATRPQNRHNSTAEQALCVARADGSPLMVLVTSVSKHTDAGGMSSEPTAILLITDPRRPLPILGRHLIDWFRLTPAEAALAVQLANGARLESLTKCRGVRISTLRSQLSAILDKTGADRQVDLIGLLHRLPTTWTSRV